MSRFALVPIIGVALAAAPMAAFAQVPGEHASSVLAAAIDTLLHELPDGPVGLLVGTGGGREPIADSIVLDVSSQVARARFFRKLDDVIECRPAFPVCKLNGVKSFITVFRIAGEGRRREVMLHIQEQYHLTEPDWRGGTERVGSGRSVTVVVEFRAGHWTATGIETTMIG